MTSLIFWNVKEAREFLILNGYAFTLRKPRSEGDALAVIGNYYNWQPIGKVNVKLILENVTHAHQLSPYVHGSGIKAQLTLNDCSYDDDAHQWFNLANAIDFKHGEVVSKKQLNLYLAVMDLTGMYKISREKSNVSS